MYDTLDHVTAAGFTWFGDWVLDDQPIWVKTVNGPILAIPYSAEINDITMMVSHHHEFDVLLDRTRDAFDRLYLESKEFDAGSPQSTRGPAPSRTARVARVTLNPLARKAR